MKNSQTAANSQVSEKKTLHIRAYTHSAETVNNSMLILLIKFYCKL